MEEEAAEESGGDATQVTGLAVLREEMAGLPAAWKARLRPTGLPNAATREHLLLCWLSLRLPLIIAEPCMLSCRDSINATGSDEPAAMGLIGALLSFN